MPANTDIKEKCENAHDPYIGLLLAIAPSSVAKATKTSNSFSAFVYNKRHRFQRRAIIHIHILTVEFYF